MTPSLLKRWPVAPLADRENLASELARVAATKPAQHWIDRMVANKVPCAPVSAYADLADKESSVGKHMYANKYMVDINHRDYGNLQWVGNPVTFSATPTDPINSNESWHSPHLGEHTSEMLKTLGFSESEADQLVADGVVPKPKGGFTFENTRKGAAGYAKKMQANRAKFLAAQKSKL